MVMAFTRLLLTCLTLVFSSSLWAVSVTYNMNGQPMTSLSAGGEGASKYLELKGTKVKGQGGATGDNQDGGGDKAKGDEAKKDDDEDKGQGGGATQRRTLKNAESLHLRVTPVEGHTNQLLVTDLNTGHQVFLHHEPQLDGGNHFNFDATHAALQAAQLPGGQVPVNIHFMLSVLMSNGLLQAAQTALAQTPVSQHVCSLFSDPRAARPAAFVRTTWEYAGTWPNAATVPVELNTAEGQTTNMGGGNQVAFAPTNGNTHLDINVSEPPPPAAQAGEQPATEDKDKKEEKTAATEDKDRKEEKTAATEDKDRKEEKTAATEDKDRKEEKTAAGGEKQNEGKDEPGTNDGKSGVAVEEGKEGEEHEVGTTEVPVAQEGATGGNQPAGVQDLEPQPQDNSEPQLLAPLLTAQVSVTLTNGIAAQYEQLGPNSDGSVGDGGSGSGSRGWLSFGRGGSSSGKASKTSDTTTGSEKKKSGDDKKHDGIEELVNHAAYAMSVIQVVAENIARGFLLLVMMNLPDEQVGEYCGMKATDGF